MEINNVPSAGQALVGKVDAIFVPNDTTVYGAFESLVKVAQDAQIPIFTAERRSVQRSAVATVGFDFDDMGKRTADVVDKVLKGTKPGYKVRDPRAVKMPMHQEASILNAAANALQ
jgi:putative tryptophan/tyrosine transport system substrate-binding protein